jgi:hypothetical protein
MKLLEGTLTSDSDRLYWPLQCALVVVALHDILEPPWVLPQ